MQQKNTKWCFLVGCRGSLWRETTHKAHILTGLRFKPGQSLGFCLQSKQNLKNFEHKATKKTPNGVSWWVAGGSNPGPFD